MKFTLKINMDNSAFDETPEQELKRILGKIAQRIGAGATSETVTDTYGNAVGFFSIDDPI